MRNVFWAMLCLLPTYFFGQYSLQVDLTGIQHPKGNLMVSIYDNDKDFLTFDRYIAKQTKVAKSGVNTLFFKNLKPGTYAVAVCHDENSNGACDKNSIGFPKEGYGFSKNFKPKFSAPKFKDTAFRLDRSSKIQIQLIN